jgi:hypothetical protein
VFLFSGASGSFDLGKDEADGCAVADSFACFASFTSAPSLSGHVCVHVCYISFSLL